MKDTVGPNSIEGSAGKREGTLVSSGDASSKRGLGLGKAAHRRADVDTNQGEPPQREAGGVKTGTAAEIKDDTAR